MSERSAAVTGCYRLDPAGVVITVRLTPKAARDSVDGIGALSDGRAVLLARVRAVPDKGEANRALCALLAKTLRVPKSGVEVIAGATARLKQVRVEGDPRALGAMIDDWEGRRLADRA
jgi:uncharacterized protein (TIGR00251 family)